MTFTSRNIHQRRSKSSKSFLFFGLILGAFFAFCVYWISSVGSIDVRPGTYVIQKGSTLQDVPEEFGLSISENRYKLWISLFAPLAPRIQAGTYKIDTPTTLSRVLTEVLQKPTYTDLTITILPGWNMYDIDAYFAEKNILPAGGLLLGARQHFPELAKKYPFLEGRISMEGFLYPDTYRILPSSDAKMILDKLLGEWEKKIGKDYTALGDKAYEELILASIVEREERISSEKPIVADILAKRVREGIAMGADATVCYGYAKTQKQCTPAFIASVIREKDTYNTRNKLGYPPTPISSISLDTWNAVMNKKSSPYYYYLHDDTGAIHYARTNDEHNKNKQTYLQ